MKPKHCLCHFRLNTDNHRNKGTDAVALVWGIGQVKSETCVCCYGIIYSVFLCKKQIRAESAPFDEEQCLSGVGLLTKPG